MTRRDFTPRAYQTRARDHMLDLPRGGLWAGMGMGKTVSALNALDALYFSGTETQPTLVTAPLRVAQSVWPAEAEKWSHLRNIEVSAVVGTEAERIAALKVDASVYTINYENVQWLVEHTGARWPFGTMVADESTKLKGFRLRQGTKRSQALARVAHNKTRRWINLTGTPAPNGLADLWGQTWFLDAGARLGRTYDGFMQRWFRPKFDGYGVEPLPFAQEQIHDKLRDLCLTLDPKDYFDLREPIVTNVYVELPSKARALYRDMERDMFMQVAQFDIEAFNAASRTMKCLQLANGAVYVGTPDEGSPWREVHDAKVQALESIVEEAAGMPVLVAYQFKSDLTRLRKAFPKGRVLDTNPQTETDWNAGKIPVMFAHPKSCGHGLNLQDGGNILAYFGYWWDLELHQQILERIGPVRQAQSGHDRGVFVYNIIARDTVDETVIARHATKRGVQDLLLEAMKERKPC